MIIYGLSKEIRQQFANKEWFVADAKTTARDNLVLEIERKNTNPIQKMKLRVENPYISNINFNIRNAYVVEVLVSSYTKIYKTEYFNLVSLTLNDGGKNYAKISSNGK